jgi:hypothetical protein
VDSAGKINFCGGEREERADAFDFLEADIGGGLGLEPSVDEPALDSGGEGAESGGGEAGGRVLEFGLGVEEIVFIAEDFGGLPKGLADFATEEFFDGGDDLVAEAIARVAEVEVGGISAEEDVLVMEESEELSFPEIEKWASDLEGETIERAFREAPDAGESGGAGATEEMEEDGFGLVVGVMSEEESGAISGVSDFGEELVAGVASGGFDGLSGLGGEGGDVLAAGDAGEAEIFGEIGDELGIVVAVRSQGVIEVTDREVLVAGFEEEMEESDGIGTTGDADEARQVWREDSRDFR